MKIDASSLEKSLLTLDRAELYALKQSAADLKIAGGNQNGLWDESGGPKLPGPGLVLELESRVRIGTSKSDEAQFVAQLLAQKQQEWGDTPVTRLGPLDLPDFTRFVTRKAIELARFDRHPSEVTEGFVTARGTVDAPGEAIAEREVFFQRYKPHADVKPSGKLVVLSPGFQETGRNFLEQVEAMNRAGHEVMLLDHQWAGHSKGGNPGGMDRLFGAARDVAAVAAHAQQILESDPAFAKNPEREVILFGNSMGGAAALAAAVLNDHGKLKLDGPQMPKGLRMVLQAPYLGANNNVQNTGLKLMGHVPGVNRLQLYSVGLPVITTDASTAEKTKNDALLERTVAQPGTMVTPEEDLAFLKKMIASGQGPLGQAMIVHAKKDLLASFKETVWLDRQLGRGSELIAIDGKNHVLEQNAKEQGFATDALERLVRGELRPTLGWSEKLPSSPAADVKAWMGAVASRIKKEVDKKIGLDSTGKIGWLGAEPPPPTDVTASFETLHAQVRTGESPLPSNAGDFAYLFVPGLFTEHYPGYFSDNLSRMEERGLDARKVDIDTDASVATNAKAVRRAILDAAKSGKQVVIVGHSKGGVDLTAALSLYPELKAHVKAAIVMQAPIGGTPIATDIQGCKELRPHVDHLVKCLFAGDPRALADLSYEARQAFLKQHPYPADIPTISLATSSSEPLSLTAPAAAYVKQRYGEDSDGLVPVRDAIVPGSKLVQLDDLDHSGPAMRGPQGLTKYRPADLTEALIALALQS